MGSPAEVASPGALVAEAFHVRDGPIRALIAELEAEHSRQVADALAQKLGLRNRFDLARLLSADHVPSVTILRGILHVVTWTYRWETQRLSLAQQALSAGRDPAAWSKTVHHLTGSCWREIRERGARRVANELAARFGDGSAT